MGFRSAYVTNSLYSACLLCGRILRTCLATPLQWLPVLNNIAPNRLRLKASLFLELKSCWSHGRSLLFDQLQAVPPIRLRSRSVTWKIEPSPLQDGYRIVDRWREPWLSNFSVNGDIVDDPSAVSPGFDLKRREWVIRNRFRTSQGKCAY
jgi:hypothetical protein